MYLQIFKKIFIFKVPVIFESKTFAVHAQLLRAVKFPD